MAEPKKLPRLHELIAVKASLRSQSAATSADLAATFEKKQHHFTARVKQFVPNGEDAPTKVEEQVELQTTVASELAWLKPYLVKAINASHAVNTGNRVAAADIVLEDGTVLVTDVPATTLLELETEMEACRVFIDKIPTLDPAKGFRSASPTEYPPMSESITGKLKISNTGIFIARTDEKTRTMKTQKVLVLSPATDKHPAQVQLVPEDSPIGTIRTQEWSAMLTITQKGDMLDRVEKLIRAVKRARSRANEQPVEYIPIAERLLDYVFAL